MHIITHKRIIEAQAARPEGASALEQWYRAIKRAKLASVADLRGLFGSVDKVGEMFWFNIGGNKLRLIATVYFNTGKVFVRHTPAHREYDLGRRKQ